MDVDMIKSSSSTAGDHHHHHHHHHNHLDMMKIMMQMDKPSPDYHHLICDVPYPNTTTTPPLPPPTFLDINFSENPPPTMFHNPNVVVSSSSVQTTSLLNPGSSSVSFMASPIPEPETPPLHPIRFKSGGAMANIVNPYEKRRNSMAAMREMIFGIAAMQPIHIDPESIKPPKRRNVKISKDPQSVAARHRRERISERIRILQRLVPGGTKMDTASMLDEAIHYVKFLKKQVLTLEQVGTTRPASAAPSGPVGFPAGPPHLAAGNVNYSVFLKAYQPNSAPMLR